MARKRERPQLWGWQSKAIVATSWPPARLDDKKHWDMRFLLPVIEHGSQMGEEDSMQEEISINFLSTQQYRSSHTFSSTGCIIIKKLRYTQCQVHSTHLRAFLKLSTPSLIIWGENGHVFETKMTQKIFQIASIPSKSFYFLCWLQMKFRSGTWSMSLLSYNFSST